MKRLCEGSRKHHAQLQTKIPFVTISMLSSPEVVNWIKGKKLDKLLVTLRTTLYAAQALLNDAEKKQIKDAAVKNWLDSLKDAVYKADDLLDEVSTKSATQKDPGNILSRLLNLQDREIANRMEDIIDTLESILKHKDALGLKEVPKEDMSWRITTSLVETSNIYGRDKDKEAIIKLLLDDTSDGEVSVIPIVGQGGIGKTTLAQLVYHDVRVKQHFDFQSWVCVSEEFDVVKVTKSIIEAITRGSCHINDLNLLQHDLSEKLSRKKFLVVLDDIWNENYDDWIMLLKPFQQGIEGSKILVTTRSRNVCLVVQTVQPHELSLMSHEDCWLVFMKHSLLSTESTQNPTLEKIGREIVNKCNGLPLIAQTLGGLLRGNYDVRYWNHVLNSEFWEFSEDRSKIIPALRISYYYLPSCLKECFIYCSLFPKDYQFEKDELILLWMAEDLLEPPKRGKSLEEVGHEYFDELVARSFFQLDTSWMYVPEKYVMHDLIHDLATFCAGEFYFRAEELGNASEISAKTRHLSHNPRGNYPISKLLASSDRIKYTRTLIEIKLGLGDLLNTKYDPSILLSGLKYLRVLSFERFTLHSLPDSICELIHLRYLNLSYTYIMALPESLSNLYNLKTLRLRCCNNLKMLPNNMKDLVNLRHLDIRGTLLKEMPKRMSRLKHLQLLSYYAVGKHEENGIRELGELANLHGSFAISKLRNVADSDEALEARIIDKKHINKLDLSWVSDHDTMDSQIERDILDKLQPHTNLKELAISAYNGTTFPDWLGHSSYHNMTQIFLSQCDNCCMLPSFGQLPCLKSLSFFGLGGLEIIGAEFYKNDESCCQTPFPSLETLDFHQMPSLREWSSFEFNAFPRLKELQIRDCPVLKGDLPSHLPALEKLTIEECSQLACSLPRAPAILKLSILDEHKVRMEELPLSLHSLSLEGSQHVDHLLEAMTQTQFTCLKSLYIKNCSSALSFPADYMPASLEKLKIQECKNFAFSLQQPHRSLKSVTIRHSCGSLTSFPLMAFPNLEKLEIYGCEYMKCIDVPHSWSDTAALSSLLDLSVVGCPNFVSFSTLWMAAPNIYYLRIISCPVIDSFPEGGLPHNLRILHITECEKLVMCLASMDLRSHGLKDLLIVGPCDSVKSFPTGGFLPATLERIELWDIQSLETLDCKGLVHLTTLQALRIEYCPKLENMAGERLPASLVRLFIRGSTLLSQRYHMKDPQIWPKLSHIRILSVIEN